MNASRLRATVLLFVLSGVTGIVFEVLWIRIFTSILGSSTQSVGAIVTAFMLGIGLGQRVLGRRADRADNLLRLYAFLELGVASLSLLAYWLFVGLDQVYRAAHAVLPEGAEKWGVFAVAFAVVTVPASLVGGTLPVLVKHVMASGAEAREGLGRLYGANTMGAALGALGTVLLVERVGYDVGYHVAVCASALTGVLALLLSRAPRVEAIDATRLAPSPDARVEALDAASLAPSPGAPLAARAEALDVASLAPSPRAPLDKQAEALTAALTPSPEALDAPGPRMLALAFALSGFSALALEVVWQRLLDFYFQATLTSFALILGTFLAGVGLGSLTTRRQRASVAQFVTLEALIATLSLLTLPLVTLIAEARGTEAAKVVFLAAVFAITFIFGAIFPLVGKLYIEARGGATLGAVAGDITAANTLGSVLGSLGASFLLIPLVGTRATLVIACVANLAAALVVLSSSRARVRLAGVLAGAAALGIAGWASSNWLDRFYLTAIDRPGFELVAERESSLQAVLVLEDQAGRRLLIGGGFESGEIDEARRQTQRLQAHLPMLLHPNPRRVLEIGYGVGEIPRTVMLYEPDQLDLVEIDPMMISVADQWFGALNQRVSTSPKVKTHVMDGRQFLRVTDSQFDVILTDSMIPVSELSLRMYALEHFAAGRAHLAPGGMMVLWLPLYIGAERVKVMLRTFREIFPQSLLWLPQGFAANEAFVVGFRETPQLDVAQIRERFARVAAPDLAPFGWTSELPYLASFIGAQNELGALVADVNTLHRDRAPVLDFIPTHDEQGLTELLAAIYGSARPVALEDFAATDATQRDALNTAIEADRAYQQVHDLETLEAMFARFPTHPTARLTVARVRCAAAMKPGPPSPEVELAAHDWLQLSPWDVCTNLVLMRGATARGETAAAAQYARTALVLQPYLKEAWGVLNPTTRSP